MSTTGRARPGVETIGIPAAVGADGRRYGAGDIDATTARLPGPLVCGGGRCEAIVHAVRGHVRSGTHVQSSFHLNPHEKHSDTCGYRFDPEGGTVHRVSRTTPDAGRGGDAAPEPGSTPLQRAPYRIELRAAAAVAAPSVGVPAAPVGPRTARLEVSHRAAGSDQPQVVQSARGISRLAHRLAEDVGARERFRVEVVDGLGVTWTLTWGQFFFDVSTVEGATAYEQHLALGRTYPVAVVGVVQDVQEGVGVRVKRRVQLATPRRRVNGRWVNASVSTVVASRLPYTVGQRALGLGVWTVHPGLDAGVQRVNGSMLCTDPRHVAPHRRPGGS